MSNIRDLENRKKIYRLIARNPGLNLSKIAETLQVSVQLVDYHTANLEAEGLLAIEKKEGYKRFYIKGETGASDKKYIGLFRQEIPLKIVEFLLKNPYSRHGTILEYLGVSSPHFSYYLRKLLKKNIIQFSSHGDKKGYVVLNEHNIISFLTRFKPLSMEKMIEDTWADFAPV